MSKLAHLRATAAVLVALSSAAHVARAERSWLIIPASSAASTARLDAAAEAASALEDALKKAGEPVLANVSAAERFELRNPSPVPLDVGTQQTLLAALAAGRRELAFGYLPEADKDLQPIELLDDATRDFLRRENASTLYEVCWSRAQTLLRNDRAAAARSAMVPCIATYPTHPPPAPPEMRELYDDVKRSISFSSLAVKGPPGCTVRVFGVAVGRTPTTLRLAAGSTPLQLECDDSPGRRHLLNLPDTSSVEINPRFDRTVESKGSLRLVYDRQTSVRELAAGDAALLGRMLGVRIVLLVNDDGSATVYKVSTSAMSRGSLGEIHYNAQGGAQQSDLQHIVRTLRRDSGELVMSAAGRPGSPAPYAHQEPAVATATPIVAESVSVARPVVGASLAVVGVGGLIGSWALYADRQNFRLEPRPLITYDVTSAFHRRGAWMLGVVGVADAATIAAEYLLLPTSDSVHLVAWLAGGAGIASAAIGITYTFTADRCEPMAVASGASIPKACYSRLSDGLFGPLLIVSSLPLLNVPLVYWIRDRMGTSATTISLTSTGILVHGEF